MSSFAIVKNFVRELDWLFLKVIITDAEKK